MHTRPAVRRVSRREHIAASVLRIPEQLVRGRQIANTRARDGERRLQLDPVPPFAKTDAELNAALREGPSLRVSALLDREELGHVPIEGKEEEGVLLDPGDLFEFGVARKRRLEVARGPKDRALPDARPRRPTRAELGDERIGSRRVFAGLVRPTADDARREQATTDLKLAYTVADRLRARTQCTTSLKERVDLSALPQLLERDDAGLDRSAVVARLAEQ